MNPYDSKRSDFWSVPGPQNFPRADDFGQFNYSSDLDGSFAQTNGQIYDLYSSQPSQISTFTPEYAYGSEIVEEPPLLEELGINFEHIIQKTIAVLNPLKQTDPMILQDADLAGPLVFGLAFGSFLLLSGKIHFSYIYGFGVLGCILIYALLILMSPPNHGLTAVCTVSILGYCLLPMVFLSALSAVLGLQTFFGNSITGLVILWCSLSASKLFVTALSMSNQQALVAYPCIR
ncbi:YIPF5-like protein [Sarcoptes scabiei]|uniref:Protein YIPF n=1 Tax=Sarcoptes scabiei TaxID=52283 RepID=A0A132A2R9_SARSC|nr:YIPF5-like protein [Sarcoptes scabiei]